MTNEQTVPGMISHNAIEAAQFSLSLLDAVKSHEAEHTVYGRQGLGWTALSRFIADGLGIDTNGGKVIVQQMVEAGDLYQCGSKKGTKIVSTLAEKIPRLEGTTYDENQGPESQHAHEEESVFSSEQLAMAERLLETIASVRNAERGIKLKTLWINDPQVEKDIRGVINMLARRKIGILEKYTPKLTRTSNSRTNSEPFVRFSSLDVYRSYKQGPETVLNWLAGLQKQQNDKTPFADQLTH
ncbi:hypothetical protein E6P97_01205 [Patescibacteria group bacterium]|nr:MAG: hypothetical protein E6P97_01205 [Patescibacteria group bacterium]